MPLLEIVQTTHVNATIRLEKSTAILADQYAAFLHAAADEVVDKALAYVFAKDREFQEFLRTPEAARATQSLRIGTAEWFRAAGEVAVALGRLGQLDALATWVHATRYVTPLDAAVGAAVTCWSRMAVHLYYAERTSVADALMETIEGHVEGRTDMDLTVTARLSGARASHALSRGDFGGVLKSTEHAASMYDLAGDIRNASMQRLALGVMLNRVGAWDEAESTLERAAADGTRLANPYIRPWPLVTTS